MEIKFRRINSFGEPAENIEDTTCIEVSVLEQIDEVHTKDFYAFYDKRIHQLGVGASECDKPVEENSSGIKFRFPSQMVNIGIENKEEIKQFAKTMREFADRLEQMIS